MVPKKHDDMKQKLSEMESNWKRALADYQNLVKRTQEQQGMMRNFACLSLVERLIPAMDSLEMAALHLNDSGLTMVVNQFRQALEEEGVTKIEAVNQVFDPSLMECIEMVDGEDNMVIEVVAQGYMIQNKVLRPAKVKVGSIKNNDNNNVKEEV
jgi:molecular chaperone GrpE